ncbi:MAG: serine/threonine protein kinase, partial [Lentisphaeria bacterium]|nr:serine/threonine protein kinase [Lentisphaeria bacterium]
MEDTDKTVPRRGDVTSLDDAETLQRHENVFPLDDAETIPPQQDRKHNGRFSVGDLIINRYKVLAELGQGGMGVVYRCLDEVAGVEVALKALPPELSHNTIEMEDVKDNFQLVHNLHHPCIASSNNLERNSSNGNYYLIMECCEGEDLRRWIRQKRREGGVTLENVLPIIRQIAGALDYAHEMKVMHRDIKPGNIIINSYGKIKVLDFGLAAQIHTSMTRVSMAYHGTSGTGPYMAPEQWRGRQQGAAADQYALAVMTYEMLAGFLPFESSDAAVLREAVLNDTADDISGIPGFVQKALNRAMSKNPADRFASCLAFVEAMENKAVPAPKPKPVPEPEKLSDSELVECLTLRMNILSFFSSFNNKYFKAERDELQQKFDRCKDEPMNADLLKVFRNIFAICEEMQKNAGVCQEVLKKQQNLEELEQFLKSNNISFPKEYHEKKTVADQLLAMKRYEAAGGVLSELCTLLSKEKELYEKKREAEEEKKRQAEEAKRKAEEEACRNIK